jgi:hypothetical protein
MLPGTSPDPDGDAEGALTPGTDVAETAGGGVGTGIAPEGADREGSDGKIGGIEERMGAAAGGAGAGDTAVCGGCMTGRSGGPDGDKALPCTRPCARPGSVAGRGAGRTDAACGDRLPAPP